MATRTPRYVYGMSHGPHTIQPVTSLPVDGKPYFCPIARCETIVEGIVVEGNTIWYGCDQCRRIPMEDGRVLISERQWHPVPGAHVEANS